MNTAEYRFGQDVFVVFHLVESPQTRPSGVLTVGFMVGNIGPGFAGIGAAQANSHHVALKSTAQSVERRHVSIDVNHISVTHQSHVNPVMIPTTNDKCNHVAWHARHLWPASFYVASAQKHALTVQLRSEMSRKPRSSTVQKFNEAPQLNFGVF